VLELADVVAGLLVIVGAAGVAARAQVMEAGGGVGQQVPVDDQDGACDGDEGSELAAALDDPAVRSPRKVSVFAAAAAISPSNPLR
jgi:hypothetical protein